MGNNKSAYQPSYCNLQRKNIFNEQVQLYSLGKFEIKSGSVVISDPIYAAPKKYSEEFITPQSNVKTCYTAIEDNVMLNNIKNGNWNSWVSTAKFEEQYGLEKGNISTCPISLVVTHPDYESVDLTWSLSKTRIFVGANSGQVGIYDTVSYRNDHYVASCMNNRVILAFDKIIKENERFTTLYNNPISGQMWYAMNYYASTGGQTYPETPSACLYANTIPHGVVSTWGIGRHSFYIATDSDKIVGIKIAYFTDDIGVDHEIKNL